MTSKSLNRIGCFLRYWKHSVLCYGYNMDNRTRQVYECFYIIKGARIVEVPCSSELILEHGLKQAWSEIKTFLNNACSLAYDANSEIIINRRDD
jgi:hypothetical protein